VPSDVTGTAVRVGITETCGKVVSVVIKMADRWLAFLPSWRYIIACRHHSAHFWLSVLFASHLGEIRVSKFLL
jgi:hypothetical protein